MKLDRWLIHGNCLVGYVYDSVQFSSGTRIITDPIRFVDPINLVAECLDGKYKLGEPGTYDEHNQELIGKKPEANIPKIDNSIFLNPNG